MTQLEYSMIGSAAYVEMQIVSQDNGFCEREIELWNKVSPEAKAMAEYVRLKELELYHNGDGNSNENVSKALEAAVIQQVGFDVYDKFQKEHPNGVMFTSFFEDYDNIENLEIQNSCGVIYEVEFELLKKEMDKILSNEVASNKIADLTSAQNKDLNQG